MEVDLSGKRAAVTAAAGGAGLVIASTLRDYGASVFVCDIDRQALASLPEGIHGSELDVADPSQVAAWLGEVTNPGLDILVNNAGIAGPTKKIEDVDVEDWRRCLDVDLGSHFFCSQQVVPTMKEQGSGVIVNIASTAGYMGMPLRSPYVAAKFGVVGLTKTLAMELGRANIRVNAIAPGSITGDRMDRVVSAHAEARTIQEVEELYTSGVSMAKFVDPQEIADVVVFLCSDHARSVSGQVIAVDGHTETLYPRPSTLT